MDEVFFAVSFEAFSIEYPNGLGKDRTTKTSGMGEQVDMDFYTSGDRKTMNISNAELDASVISLRNTQAKKSSTCKC